MCERERDLAYGFCVQGSRMLLERDRRRETHTQRETNLAYRFCVQGSRMLGKRTVRSPRAMMALALTTGREERSSTVNSSRT